MLTCCAHLLWTPRPATRSWPPTHTATRAACLPGPCLTCPTSTCVSGPPALPCGSHTTGPPESPAQVRPGASGCAGSGSVVQGGSRRCETGEREKGSALTPHLCVP